MTTVHVEVMNSSLLFPSRIRSSKRTEAGREEAAQEFKTSKVRKMSTFFFFFCFFYVQIVTDVMQKKNSKCNAHGKVLWRFIIYFFGGLFASIKREEKDITGLFLFQTQLEMQLRMQLERERFLVFNYV